MIAAEAPFPSRGLVDSPPWAKSVFQGRMLGTKICSETESPSSRLISLLFIPFRLTGIVESPGVVWNGKSSTLFKIYGGLLLAMTFVGCLRNFYLCYHYSEDPILRILEPKETFYCRLIYTIVAFKASGCRLVCFLMFNFEQRLIADAHSRIASE